MAKRNPKTHKVIPQFYETEPYVPKKKIAAKPLVQNASLGNDAPKMVPHKPGRSSGLFPHQAGHAPKHGGSKISVPQLNSKLKLSGAAGAHHIGKR